LLVSCASVEQVDQGEATSMVVAGESWRTIVSDGVDRKYLLYVPASYDGSAPVPLVLGFHGSGSDPVKQLIYSDFKGLAEEEGVVLALPLGIYDNNGKNSWNTVNDPSGADDVQLVRDVIEAVDKDISIDPKRIYATGFSGGGRMTSRLACELGDTLAAFAPVSGIQFPTDCSPSRGVDIITFHGKHDLVNHYAWGDYSPKYWKTGVEESVAGWVDKNECVKDPESEKVSEVVAKVSWPFCRDDSQLVFYRIEDGGHTWPGSPITLTAPWSGKTNGDISASKLIWEFFEANPLN
jgi:polyhydroxybutyrate depolymerase